MTKAQIYLHIVYLLRKEEEETFLSSLYMIKFVKKESKFHFIRNEYLEYMAVTPHTG